MGAQEFECIGHGNTAQEAFNNAVQDAQYEYGHGGYTGTIAEKSSFKQIPCEQDQNVIAKVIDECLGNSNHFCQDKWGPAACIQMADTSWVFFGWASS